MLVHEFLERSADRLPDKLALVCADDRLTYSDIEAKANRLANTLLDLGFTRGDRAVLFLPNCVDLVIGIFSVLKAGGVFVNANPTIKEVKLGYLLSNCEAKALITSGRNRDLADQLLKRIPSLEILLFSSDKSTSDQLEPFTSFRKIYASAQSSRPQNTNIDVDLACLIYTSGSTGDPKGVMSDHSNVDFATGSIISYLENIEDDIVINALPLSFDYGLYQLLMTFKFGGTLILERSFAYPAQVLQRIAEEGVTGFPGVPTMFSVILNMDLDSYDLSSLRYITNTAAALPTDHIEALRRSFPSVRIYSMYGLTETKRTLYLPPEQLARRPGSVGIAIPGTEVWIEDEQGRRLGPGEVGELIVRGRHVMRGYWGDKEATSERYKPGPLPGERVCYTDDLFKMDDEGYLYFVSRKDDIIKSRGEKVSPKEVENVLYQLPGILEAAVFGVPDPILGQSIKATVVTLDPALTKRAVLAHCRAHLEDFMIPSQIQFMTELPKSSSGKILKRDLKLQGGKE